MRLRRGANNGISLAALTAASGGVGPIGTPASVVADAQTIGSASTVYATSGAIPPNSLIRVSILGTGSVASTAVSDAVNGSYTAGYNVSASFQRQSFYVYSSAGLASGANITVTWASAGSHSKYVQISYVTGIVSPTASSRDIGGGAGTTGTSTAPSITTGTLAQANSIIFADITASAGGADSFTEASGWTSLTPALAASALRVAYKVVSATTAETYAPTLGTSRAWTANYDIFKGA